MKISELKQAQMEELTGVTRQTLNAWTKEETLTAEQIKKVEKIGFSLENNSLQMESSGKTEDYVAIVRRLQATVQGMEAAFKELQKDHFKLEGRVDELSRLVRPDTPRMTVKKRP